MKPRQWQAAAKPQTLEARCDVLCKGDTKRVVLKATDGHLSPRYAVAETMAGQIIAYGRGATFDEALTELEGKLS